MSQYVSVQHKSVKRKTLNPICLASSSLQADLKKLQEDLRRKISSGLKEIFKQTSGCLEALIKSIIGALYLELH